MKKIFNDFNKLLILILLVFIVILFIIFPSMIKSYLSFGFGLIMLIGLFIMIKSTRAKSKNPNSFGEIIGMLFMCLFMGSISVMFMILPFSSYLSQSDVEADGFTIEGYEVILDVGLDNKIEVTEKIDINFFEKGHHGIYKVTPTWLKYTGKDNKTIKRRSVISDYRAIDDKYQLETVGSKEKIKIGNEYITVYGRHDYEIKYTYDMGSDPYNGFDELIFHAFGDYWGTTINNPKIVINMPKDFDEKTINLFTDKYRKNNVNHLVNIEREDNTVIITAKDLLLTKSLTIDIELPDDYFIGGSYNYGWFSLIITIIIIAITIYIFVSWIKYGKDYDKEIPTVEFYAPDNLNSAEIGYIYNGCHENIKLTISLIVELASKGYIKIDEIKGEKKKDTSIKISRLTVKTPSNTMNSDKRQIVIKKLNNNLKHLKSKEKEMLDYLFSNNESVKILSDRFDQFDQVKDSLLKNKCIEIVSDNSYDLSQNIENKKEVSNNVKELNPMDDMEREVYNKLFSSSDVIILKDHKTFYTVFKSINDKLNNKLSNRIYDEGSKKKRTTITILSIIMLILSLMSFFDIEDLNPKWEYLYYVAFACVIIDFVFAIIMGRKTKYGEALSARVKGFRDFLVTAEKDKLESLVESNPNYFYDILPYTYVLNISKKWIEKFQDIHIPARDMGTLDYTNSDLMFNSIVSSVSFPSSGSSSGSSGGCSSCGGGCSSCGGGGSW